MPIRLNLPQARENLGGDESLLRELAVIFKEDSPELLRLLDCNVKSQNDAEAERAAHSLKSMCGTFGAEPATSLAEQAEMEARQSQWEHLVGDTLPRLRSAVAAAIEALRMENVLPEDRV